MKAQYRHEVRNKIKNKPFLQPVFSHVSDIPRLVWEYDRSFFVVFNKRSGRFEIHSLDYPENQSISCTIPFDALDERTMDHLRYNDVRVHGKEIFRRLERSEEQRERKRKRKEQEFLREFAIEHRSEFAKDAWQL